MMLTHLGFPDEEPRIEAACARALDEAQCTRDVGGTFGTRAAADYILAALQ